MNKYVVNVFFILTLLLQSGCTAPATREEMRVSPYRQENLIFDQGYQPLLRCFDQNADKVTLDFKNATAINIYPEMGYAEIQVSAGRTGYYLLFEVRKISVSKTQVNAYGVGYLGEKFVPKWIETLRMCSLP